MLPRLQILFLNKDDLFVKKVQTSDIKNFFPVRSLLWYYLCREVESNICYKGLRRGSKRSEGRPGILQTPVWETSSKSWTLERTRNLYSVSLHITSLCPLFPDRLANKHLLYILPTCSNLPQTSGYVIAYTSVTTATDTALLRVVMAAVEGTYISMWPLQIKAPTDILPFRTEWVPFFFKFATVIPGFGLPSVQPARDYIISWFKPIFNHLIRTLIVFFAVPPRNSIALRSNLETAAMI